MTASRRVSSSLAVAFALSSVILGLGVLIGQEPQPSATPAPSPSLSQIPRVRASPTPDVGAQNFHRWGSITIFNGLPSDAVHAIAQTADGIMWFGTDNGLARFDGRRVERISLGDEASNRVQTLGASKNDLWIGTQNGAFLFRDGAAQPVSGTDGSNITAISSGQPTFLGTEGGEVSTAAIDANGLPSIVAKLGKVIVKGQNVRVTSFARTPSQILVGTSGVGLFTVKDERIEPLATKGLPSFINGLAVDGESLLIASDAAKGASGLYSLSENNRTADRLKPPTARVNAVAAANPDIWAGLDRNGAVHVSNYKTETFTFANTSGGLRSDTVFSVLVDSEGVVWFGTNRGVSRYDPLAPDQESISDLPNSNFVRTLFLYGNEYALYVGTNRGAFREHGASWEKVAWIGDRIVYDIDALPGKPDSTIFATSDGLRVRNGQTLISGDIRAVNSFQSKMYAAQFGRGVVDITDPDHPHLIFENAGVVSLGGYVGRMWIGTATDGLFSFDGATVRPEIRPADIDTGTVWSVGEAGLNTGAWIAAEHGVFHLKNGVAERIIPADDVRDVFALPDLGQKTGQVSSADREDIDVWAATTSRGLIHGRRDKDFGWLFSSLGFEQGLPSDKVFSIAVVRGKLVLATNRGLVSLPFPLPAPPKITAVRVLSQRAHDLRELASTIALDYPQNSLLVEVAGLSSRTFPEEFQYAWLLKNGKSEVIDRRVNHDPQYSPAGLKSGEYSIEVRAINRDLLLSDPLVVKFSIGKAPFPWTATALGVLLVIAITGLIFAVIEHERIRERNRQLATARLNLANEAERERRRIARDLHDQTLADLRQLLMRADEMHAASLRSEVETISSEIRRICEDLSPSVLENVGLIAALEHLLTTTVANGTFHVGPSLAESVDLPMTTQLQIYRIMQEVLTNIRLHSDASTVAMEIASNDLLRFSITDNGSSFTPDRGRPNGRGIANIKARADLIGSRVSWRPSDAGNRFELLIG